MLKNKYRHHRPSAVANARVVKTFPVYAHDRVLGESPLYFIDQKTRDVWIEQGAVVPITAYPDGKRAAALRLLLNLPPKPQNSVTMGPSVVMGQVRGYRDIVAAWGPGYAPSCQWPRAGVMA